jgi:hypothetical protein
MVCEAVDEFPHTSKAVQVLVTLYSPAQSPAVVASTNVKENALPQASVAVAAAKTGVAGQVIVEVAGNVAITGAAISWTMTVWDADALFPQPSVAVHILVILYSEGQSPGVITSLEERKKGYPQASDAPTEKEGVDGQLIVAIGGFAITVGGVTSWTLIVCDAVELLPQASVAVHVLVTEYSPRQSPGVVTSA